MRFHTKILQTGKNTTGIEVPVDVVEALAAGKKPAVTVTVNAYTYRSSIASMGGVYLIPVSADVRAKSGVGGGDEVDVDVDLDTEPREVLVPADLSSALDAGPEARSFFDGLSYSNKRRIVLSIDDAKTPETRARRIEAAVAKLREGKV